MIILTKSCDCKVTGKNLATQLNHAQVDTLWLMSKHQVNIWIIFWWKIIDSYTDDPIDPYTERKPKYNSKYNNPILLFIFLSRHWIQSSLHPPPLCWLLSCCLLLIKILSSSSSSLLIAFLSRHWLPGGSNFDARSLLFQQPAAYMGNPSSQIIASFKIFALFTVSTRPY